MPYFEIINPSDMCTMKGENWPALCAATLLLGNGLYGLHEIADDAGNSLPDDTGRQMPIFFGDSGLSWFKNEVKQDLTVYLKEHGDDVAACLESCSYGRVGERITVDKAMTLIENADNRKAFLADWLDRRRSSMNNICKRAQELANVLRKRHAGPIEPVGVIVAPVSR